ncbi:MAG: RNA polymerase factor sigma-54 [Candidatus Omnitrophica bacterium]|nr:RNA polymerase factor sigma-54 [Candidatus Omnitrophota bacterium]
MEQRLVQKQTQKLLFTQKMQASVQILQMSVMELKDIVETEMESNPILEEIPHTIQTTKPRPRIEENDYRKELRLTKPLTLQEELIGQLNIHASSKEAIEIGREIIGNIDDDGYLKASSEEISHSLKKDIIEVEKVIALIQTFEPTGVCAGDLKECLLIQLSIKGKKDSLPWKIVQDHLPGCAKKQYLNIARDLDVSVEEVKAAVSEITKLDPRPGGKYSNHVVDQHIVPDIHVKKLDDGYQIVNNQFYAPNIKINSYYRNMLKDKACDKKTRDYIKGKFKSANFLIRCILQRNETMQKLTEFIVKEQAEAIEKGRSFIKPLTFKTVAEAIGRHESTISRAISNKYMETPSGIYSFREFFNGKISKVNGNGNGNGNGHDSEEGPDNNDTHHSTISVKIEVKSLVDKEDKRKPLSDKKLQMILEEKDIKISRRTIAKYREKLKILPSYLRKQ